MEIRRLQSSRFRELFATPLRLNAFSSYKISEVWQIVRETPSKAFEREDFDSSILYLPCLPQSTQLVLHHKYVTPIASSVIDLLNFLFVLSVKCIQPLRLSSP